MSKKAELSLWEGKTSLQEIKGQFGKDLSDSEFNMLCGIGKATNLNPFLREIWAVKYGGNPACIFIGRDGYRKSAQAHKEYDFHTVDSVYSKDDFSVNNGEVSHSFNLESRGTLLGAYCLVKRKTSSRANYNFVDFKEYTTGKSLWAKKPSTMIKKVAEAQGLRGTFQELFAGTYDESEKFEEENRATTPPVKMIKPGQMEKCKTLWNDYILASGTPKEKTSDLLDASLRKKYKKNLLRNLTEAEGIDFEKSIKEIISKIVVESISETPKEVPVQKSEKNVSSAEAEKILNG